MPRRRNPVPSYRLHRQSGQAIVTVRDASGRRRDVLLGRYDTPESRAEYTRVVAEAQAGGPAPAGPAASDLTVAELILTYWKHAETHYRHPDGTPTSELAEYRYSLRALRELYGHTPAARFGPLGLKAVRQRMVAAGWCRGLVNQRVGRVKRVFKWAVGEELVPPSVLQALQAVAGLARGRTEAREAEPVRPVPEAHVRAVLPHVLPPVAAMVELQLLTGARPGELCALRACDLDTSGDVRLYRPARHKSSWRGKPRVVALGPQAQAVVKRFLVPDLSAYLFSPARAMAERSAALRAARKTRV